MISNSSQEEFVLRKIFKDFDTNNSGTLTIDEMAAMLAKLGISVERKYISAMIKVLDTNKTGMLEFEEFANFLIYDPYKWWYLGLKFLIQIFINEFKLTKSIIDLLNHANRYRI